ncbi:MAG TPA: hypothetical protein VMJ11_10175 [Paraburkholderia sp.]|uniref:hypothetical protein n=1 Tax=Paraburkholderia sp. TaxID=1926495 RepID=UPI002BFDF108|nr:hypothetical protein [Paraburkholderia sp.]HTR07000.1 hypothetical protein [Paraburkholderia sp.]
MRFALARAAQLDSGHDPDSKLVHRAAQMAFITRRLATAGFMEAACVRLERLGAE